MNDFEIKRIPFLGTELMAARDNDGQIWAGVSYICRGIGLSEDQKRHQSRVVQSDEVLREGCAKFDTGVFDPNNPTIALKLDFVPLWLAKINITPVMKAEHPEVAETLRQYQLHAKDVLAAAFLPRYIQEPDNVYRKKATSLGEVAQFVRVIRMVMKENGQPPQEISKTVVMICEQFGIKLPLTFVKESPFEQISIAGLKE